VSAGVSRRVHGWWVAGLLVPLILAGLVLMHAVDPAPAEATGNNEHALGGAGVDSMETHSAPKGDCEGCHRGVHMSAVCIAMLGSIAIWRLTRRLTGDTSSLLNVPGAAHRPRPPALLRSELPPWVALCVMRN
jgi:hypothetical protein